MLSNSIHMLKAQYCPYQLRFRFEARTSRATMRIKDTYFIRLYDTTAPSVTLGIGECALFRGLSAEDCPDYETQLAKACLSPQKALDSSYSSIRFGFETALSTLSPSAWLLGKSGIPTNGLVWMGDKATMAERIDTKIEQGFRVLKLKIGGIDFEDEVALLDSIRRRYSPETLEIRLDANGSFSTENAKERLGRLAEFSIHSIEQPLKAGQTEAMAALCRTSPIPIALDEELIGCRSEEEARKLVEDIMPQYLILKPSLCGGFAKADDYIRIATSLGIGWWATSALESNVGLLAIAAWVAAKDPAIPQGLGTGMLYYNNVESPLEMHGNSLYFNPARPAPNIDALPWRN